MTKFEKENRHPLYVLIKKNNLFGEMHDNSARRLFFFFFFFFYCLYIFSLFSPKAPRFNKEDYNGQLFAQNLLCSLLLWVKMKPLVLKLKCTEPVSFHKHR